ncbi:MAG: GMC oxidoreductase [Pseudomonadota bacterium]|nr:GMC oxidoreductase [Pseudomonadota bacterium]
MTYDFAIVGSGFGGSICARALAQSGAKVLVVERGPWRDTQPVRALGIAERAPLPGGWRVLTHGLRTLHSRLLPGGSLTLNRRGMFEVFSMRGLDVLCTSGVGGGSHAYAGLLDRPADAGYWRGRHPQLEPHQVERYYAGVLQDLGAAPLSQALHPNTVWSQLRALAAPAFMPAREQDQPHVGVRYPSSGAMAADGAGRSPSRFDGDSFLGSHGGAKATADVVYLAPALHAGAQLRELCEVQRIVPGAGASYAVELRDLRRRVTERVLADRVIVAAGTMNSLRLLFRSSASPADGLRPMPALGRRFGSNTDMFGFWRQPAAALSSFDAPACLGRFTYEGRAAPYFVLGSFAGLQALPLPGFVRRRLGETLLVIAMAQDSGEAGVCWRHGRIAVSYNRASEPVFEHVQQIFRTLTLASGNRVGIPPKSVTVHPWGGAGIGADAAQGVVDHRGEVHGNPGLFVADGSILPAAPGAPPTLAIAAWAHHIAERLTRG